MTTTKMFDALPRSPAEYIAAARSIERSDAGLLRATNVAIVSTFTIDLIRPYLVVHGASRGLRVRPYFGPFGQLEQQLSDGRSDLYKTSPEIIIIAGLFEDLLPKIRNDFLKLSASQIDDDLDALKSRLSNIVASIRTHTTAHIFVCNFGAPIVRHAGIAGESKELSATTVYHKANTVVASTCHSFANTYVIDCERLVTEVGLNSWFDAKLWYSARSPMSFAGQVALGDRLARYCKAAVIPPKKCLVVDFDNTIWGGVLGEDGIEQISLGDEYPGVVYKDFQRYLLTLRDQGFLLAAASKNNESDATEVFDRHSDCLIKRDHFAAWQVNWNDKAENLAAIAEELNIGLDAIAFFDDNPLERDWVAQKIPEVTVVPVPDDPMRYIRTLDESGLFDRLSVTAEDLRRAELYQTETVRKRVRASATSVDEFLKQLQVKVIVGKVERDSLARVAQLVAKTNQFNLTVRRRTAAEVEALSNEGGMALWARVEDKYGDSGLVGSIMATKVPLTERWIVDLFVVSCRVLGRRVESAMLSALSEAVIDRRGSHLIGEYVPSRRNGIVASFYADHGFREIGVENESLRWEWDLSAGPVPSPGQLIVEHRWNRI